MMLPKPATPATAAHAVGKQTPNGSAQATPDPFAQDLLFEFPKSLGMKTDQHAYVSSTAPQSAYTPIV